MNQLAEIVELFGNLISHEDIPRKAIYKEISLEIRNSTLCVYSGGELLFSLDISEREKFKLSRLLC